MKKVSTPLRNKGILDDHRSRLDGKSPGDSANCPGTVAHSAIGRVNEMDSSPLESVRRKSVHAALVTD